VLLAKSLGVSFEWLMTGRGPMKSGDMSAPQFMRAEETRGDYAGLSEEEIRISKTFAALPAKTRAAILHLIEALPREK
jgi:hypothetical protein